MSSIRILYYHRITSDLDDYNFTNVSPDNLAIQLKYLIDNYKIVKLRDIVDPKALKDDEETIVITFDDGYANVIDNALPTLKKYSIPATFFITTENIDEQGENWTDAVIRVALQPCRYNNELSLDLDGKQYTWRTDVLEKRVEMYRSVRGMLGAMNHDKRREVLNHLNEWAGIPNEARESRRIMNREEILELSKTDGMDIGAHTVTHPFLTSLTDDEISWEISESKRRLEEITGTPVTSFAYPFGQFSEAIIQKVKDSGFEMAVTCTEGVVTTETDLMQIPRYDTRNYDRYGFEKFMKEKVFAT